MTTSGDSIRQSATLALKLRPRIVALARAAGPRGLTINDAQSEIQDHKASSVSARFSELESRGALVRVLVGYDPPTKRYPKGEPRYTRRFDEETKRNVNVYWVPEFAPAAASNERSLYHKSEDIPA
jgi:hypothetical protein